MRYLVPMLLLFLVAGCKQEDKCASVSCKNSASCTNGTCNCDQYHTGTLCEKEMRESYYGTYLQFDTASGFYLGDSMLLNAYPGNVQKMYLNFDTSSVKYEVDLQANGKFTIPSGDYGSAGQYTTSGSGDISNNVLHVELTSVGSGGTVSTYYYGRRQ